MKPKCVELDYLVKIENDEDVEGLTNMSKYFYKYILIFVICTLIEAREEEISEKYNGELKKESDEKELTDFCIDTFYIAIEWVYGDKEKILDWADFDGNGTVDVPLDESNLKNTPLVNCDTSSSSLKILFTVVGITLVQI